MRDLNPTEKRILQKILDPNIFAPSIPLEPWTTDLYTDNILTQTIARLLGFDPVNKVWRSVIVDDANRVLVADFSSAPLVSMDNCFTLNTQIQDTALDLAAGNTGILDALDFLCDASGFSVGVRVDGEDLQFSFDGIEAGPWLSPLILYTDDGENSYFKLDVFDAITPVYGLHLKRPIRYQDSLRIKVFNNTGAYQACTVIISYRNRFK